MMKELKKWLQTRGKAIFSIAVSLLLTTCGNQDDANCVPFASGSYDKYEFPIKPGMPEWEAFTTAQQMMDACQVPEATLEQMTTQGLVETCLDYPLLGDMLAYTNIQMGTERQMENFNGFLELQTRADAAGLMLGRFEMMEPDCFPNGGDLAIGQYGLEFIEIGMLLSQDVFIGQLEPAVRRKLLNEALKKYDLFLRDQEHYGILNLKVAAFTMAKVMLVEAYLPFEEEVAQNEAMALFVAEEDIKNDVEILNTIIEYATNF